MRIVYVIAACLLLVTFMPAQEHDRDADAPAAKLRPAVRKARLQRTSVELQRLVNASASVENECKRDGSVVRVLERSTISEFNACQLVLLTRKTTIFPTSQRELDFTTYADLADLTIPIAVETQSFPSCQSKNGPIWKVTGNLAPGKTMRVTRESKSAAAVAAPPQTPTEIARRDLTFFFTDPAAAKKAGHALETAIRLCGGAEWPDDGDLP